jgi:hypothetical protein
MASCFLNPRFGREQRWRFQPRTIQCLIECKNSLCLCRSASSTYQCNKQNRSQLHSDLAKNAEKNKQPKSADSFPD